MQIISRKEAIKIGLTRFFTGKPCKYGHVAPRKTHSHACTECARLLVNKTRHPSLGGNATRNRTGRYTQGVSFPEVNGELFDLKIYSPYPDKARAKSAKRRAKIRKSEGYHSQSDILEHLVMQLRRCADPMCKVDLNVSGYHVDHIVPISKGGSNWPDNLQILCPTCNMRKGAKMP